MAAGKVDTRQLRAIDDVCRSGYEPGDPRSTTRFLDANRDFHVTIARATGNLRLADTVERLIEEMSRLLHLGLGLRNRSNEVEHEHRALMKALTRGDGETAERICREQIEEARNMVLSAILTSKSVMNLALQAE
jgi:DNA-binding GntR family transcriptional regulator